MRSVKEIVTSTLEIQKSKFFGILSPISSEADVNLTLDHLRKDYPSANHYTYAYILGDFAQFQKASDDKEPSKTAGMPILEILKKAELTNVLCVVIRYFGGIKLGTSGLIRAYAKTAKQCTLNAIFTYKKTFHCCKLITDYLYLGLVEQVLRDYVFNTKEIYEKLITYTFEVEDILIDQVDELLYKATAYTSRLIKVSSYAKYIELS